MLHARGGHAPESEITPKPTWNHKSDHPWDHSHMEIGVVLMFQAVRWQAAAKRITCLTRCTKPKHSVARRVAPTCGKANNVQGHATYQTVGPQTAQQPCNAGHVPELHSVQRKACACILLSRYRGTTDAPRRAVGLCRHTRHPQCDPAATPSWTCGPLLASRQGQPRCTTCFCP